MNWPCSRVWTWHEKHTSTSIRPLHLSGSVPLHTFSRFQSTASISFLSTHELRFPASSASLIYQRGSCFKNKTLRVLNKTSLWTKVDLGKAFFNGLVWWYQLINIKFSASTRIWKLKWLLLNVCAELTLCFWWQDSSTCQSNTERVFPPESVSFICLANCLIAQSDLVCYLSCVTAMLIQLPHLSTQRRVEIFMQFHC